MATLNYFLMLTQDEQLAAIQRLAASKVSASGIAAATGLSIKMVRKILAQSTPEREPKA